MTDVVFDPKQKGTRFFCGDSADWAVYSDGKCFGVNPGQNIGYAPNKNCMDVFYQEGTEVSRKQFAEMYPQLRL